MVGFCHWHFPTMVGFCHGGNVLGNRCHGGGQDGGHEGPPTKVKSLNNFLHFSIPLTFDLYQFRLELTIWKYPNCDIEDSKWNDAKIQWPLPQDCLQLFKSSHQINHLLLWQQQRPIWNKDRLELLWFKRQQRKAQIDIISLGCPIANSPDDADFGLFHQID